MKTCTRELLPEKDIKGSIDSFQLPVPASMKNQVNWWRDVARKSDMMDFMDAFIPSIALKKPYYNKNTGCYEYSLKDDAMVGNAPVDAWVAEHGATLFKVFKPSKNQYGRHFLVFETGNGDNNNAIDEMDWNMWCADEGYRKKTIASGRTIKEPKVSRTAPGQRPVNPEDRGN